MPARIFLIWPNLVVFYILGAWPSAAVGAYLGRRTVLHTIVYGSLSYSLFLIFIAACAGQKYESQLSKQELRFATFCGLFSLAVIVISIVAAASTRTETTLISAARLSLLFVLVAVPAYSGIFPVIHKIKYLRKN
jgi:hypothetical protein